MQTILQDPHPLLRQVSQPVTDFGPSLSVLFDRMRMAVHDWENEFGKPHRKLCVGLAAIQLGVPLRVVLIAYGHEQFLINPVIVRQSPSEQRVNDGCLSVRNGTLNHTTARPAQLVVEYVDRDGNPRRAAFKGLKAAIVHHELDHLDGKLFTDLVKEQAA